MAARYPSKHSAKRSELVRVVRFLLAVTVFVFGLGFVSVQEADLFDVEPAAASDG